VIPFPNVIAGILIGVFNETWLARLILPFVWGLVYCVSHRLSAENKEKHL